MLAMALQLNPLALNGPNLDRESRAIARRLRDKIRHRQFRAKMLREEFLKLRSITKCSVEWTSIAVQTKQSAPSHALFSDFKNGTEQQAPARVNYRLDRNPHARRGLATAAESPR